MTDQELARLIVEQGPTPGAEFVLSHRLMTLGREVDCEIHILSDQVSRHHARITREDRGYLLADLDSRNGTYVNTQRLTAPRLLQAGDEIRLGQFVALRFVAPEVSSPTLIAPIPPAVHAPPTAPAPVPPTVQMEPPNLATLVGQRPSPPAPAAPPSPPAPAEPPSQSTMIAQRPNIPVPAAPPPPPPPQLSITHSGATTRYDLTAKEISLGRADDNDIVVASGFVSRKHLRLVVGSPGTELEFAL